MSTILLLYIYEASVLRILLHLLHLWSLCSRIPKTWEILSLFSRILNLSCHPQRSNCVLLDHPDKNHSFGILMPYYKGQKWFLEKIRKLNLFILQRTEEVPRENWEAEPVYITKHRRAKENWKADRSLMPIGSSP